MGEKNILDFLGSLFSSMFGFGSNIFTNMMNKRYQEEANKTNLEIARQTNEANMNMTAATNLANRELVREQNAAAAAEAEKAYQRSKPTTQVANMQAAGMSLAGAINSLNGGGSYSPAPVNVSSDEASRNQSAHVSPAQLMSSEGVFANIANAFMQREQIKSSERMHKDVLKQQAAEAQKQREHEILLKDIDTLNQTNRDYLDYSIRERELQLKSNDFEFRKEQYKNTAEQIKENTKYTKAQRLQFEALFDEWQSEPAFSARQAKYQMEKIASVLDYRIKQNDLQVYLDKYFVKNDDGEYVPLGGAPTGSIEGATDMIDKVWSLILTIIPVKTVLESIKLFGS